MSRATVEGDGYWSFDLRASRTFKFGDKKSDRALWIGLDAFKVGNNVNYTNYVGTVAAIRGSLLPCDRRGNSNCPFG